MANQEQVALLRQSMPIWNKWREKNPDILIDLSTANLRGTDLHSANLRSADLSEANLNQANLCGADLSEANLSQANLCGADLSEANLRSADLSEANLSEANLSQANFSSTSLCRAILRDVNLSQANLHSADLRFANLSRANLCSADLSQANLIDAKLSRANLRRAELSRANLSVAKLRFAILSEADLSEAILSSADLSSADVRCADLREAILSEAILSSTNLSEAILSSANLIGAKVLNANFSHATLTGACIQDWHLGSSTILDNVKCDYVFRTFDVKNRKFSGRLPVNPENTFAPGEFTKRFQIIASALETIDITFTEGIDWQAFFQSFQELRSNRSEETISIQGMERKGDAFIVRLEVEAEADKASIETEAKQLYASQIATLEAQYEKQLRLQSEEIAHYRQTQSSLLHIVQTMAEKDSISQTFNTTANIVGSIGGNNYGSMNAYIGASAAERQNLSGTAEEIRDLLDTLAETYNSATSTGQEKLMQELDQETKKHPKWRRALKEGGIELIKVLFAPIGIPLEMARVYLEDE